MKKLFAILLAVAMLLSLGIVAYANEGGGQEGGGGSSSGTIRVVDVAVGSVYKIYKVFGATVDTGTNKITYQNDGVFSTEISTGMASTNDEDAAVNFYMDGSNIVANAGFSAADFATWLKAKLNGKTEAGSATADANGVAEFTNVAPGYYLIVPQTPADAQAALATVINGRITQVQNKNDMPLDKDVERGDTETGGTDDYDDNGEGVKVGDQLQYKITGKMPVISGNNYDYTYIVTDKMTEGLTFGGEVTVTIGDGQGAITLTLKSDGTISGTNTAAVWGEPFVVVPTTNNMPLTGNKIRFGHADTENGGTFTFELSLDVANDVMRLHGSEPITITYTATVNANAQAELLQNTAVLTYGESNDLKYKDAETDNYISRIVVDKFETGNRSQKLPGAKFKLYKLKDSSLTGDALHAESNRAYYNLNNGTVSWEGAGTERETDENGYTDFPYLEDGTYYLIETQAPVDYTKLQGYIEVVVDGSAAADTRLTQQQRVDALTNVVNVANRPGSSMPSTGGVGATLLTIGGIALMLAAGAYLILRRKEQE